MQWYLLGLIEPLEGDRGDRLVVDELLADVLFFCNPSCISDIAACIAKCSALRKTSVRGVCTIQQQPYSFSKLLCLRRTYHSATVWGKPCLRRTYHSTTVWGKPYSFSKLLCFRRTYHSTTVWGKPCSFSIPLRTGCAYVFGYSVGYTIFVNFRELDTRTIPNYTGRLAPIKERVSSCLYCHGEPCSQVIVQ